MLTVFLLVLIVIDSMPIGSLLLGGHINWIDRKQRLYSHRDGNGDREDFATDLGARRRLFRKRDR